VTGTRVLVSGVGDRLGRLIAERMAARADVEAVIGVAGADTPTVAGVQVVGLPGEYDGIAELLRERAIDTIIHADRSWARRRVGPDATAQHVIATMRLAAAAARRTTTVRRLVMASATRVYPVSSRAARLHPESEHLQPRRGSLAALLVEAEEYVRTLGTTNPNLSASILRLADLTGPGTRDPLAALLAGPVIPAVWGFDPSVQLLHVDDAVTALGHAADHDLAGIYNVGADDLVRWRRVASLTRKPLLELPPAFTTQLAGVFGWLYRLDDPEDLLNVLRFGRVAATDAFTRSGFRPTRTTVQCMEESAHPSRRRASADEMP
jgi:UDP-glucose 4-epimerase